VYGAVQVCYILVLMLTVAVNEHSNDFMPF